MKFGNVAISNYADPYSRHLAKSRRKLSRGHSPDDLYWYAAMLTLDADFDEALVWTERCIKEFPHYEEAQYLKALILLTNGDYREGFRLHEYRDRVYGARKPIFRQLPQWDGTPTSDPVIVWNDAGFGDAMQMTRWWPDVVARCPNAILMLESSLVDLLKESGMPGIVMGWRDITKVDGHAWQLPLMSLPYIFGAELHTLSGAPYLKAPPGLTDYWRAKLLHAPKIGLVAQGNMKHERDVTRSLRAEVTQRLLDRCGDMLSLLPEHTQPKDWRETAAIIATLDLVISVDTSAAHLAAAMGKPTWILLSYDIDWRWGRFGDRTPWYDSVRLFRCRHHDDWDHVIEQMAQVLQMAPRVEALA